MNRIQPKHHTLRPFFNYFGAKWRLAPKYPAPSCDTIIEPFAGAAGYSVRNHHKKVILYDADPRICEIWDFLINASRADIMSMPLIRPAESIHDLHCTPEQKLVIGMWLSTGRPTPSATLSKWATAAPDNFWGEKIRHRLASQVSLIKHWRIIHGDYLSVPQQRATWFIDPPYRGVRGVYDYDGVGIDYMHLAQWCMSRDGQVIVCENTDADWLDFKFLFNAQTHNNKKRSSEAVWIK